MKKVLIALPSLPNSKYKFLTKFTIHPKTTAKSHKNILFYLSIIEIKHKGHLNA